MTEALPKPLTFRRWVVFTFVGWLAGIFFILFLSGIFDSLRIEGYQFYVGLGMGGGVGVMQWLVLRKFGFTLQWVWATALGLGIPFLTFDVVFKALSLQPWSLYLPLSVVTGGLLVSILQFRLLKAYAEKVSHWILSSAIGWWLPVLMLVSMDYIKFMTDKTMILFFFNLTMIVSGGLVPGLCTGKILLKILQTKLKEA